MARLGECVAHETHAQRECSARGGGCRVVAACEGLLGTRFFIVFQF